MKILIIEDNELISKTLQRNLKSHYQIDVAREGLDGLHKSTVVNYDAILLDLQLPDISGEEVCNRMRSQKVTSPIIVVSGKSHVTSKVELLGMGADDYLVKPFNLEELKARIQVAMRRTENKAPNGKLIIGNLILDPLSRVVTSGTETVELRRKEFDLLAYLMYNQGQTLTRAMIMEHIWGTNDNLWANVIDVHIKHLRDKVDRRFGTKYIKTMHGLGYKFDHSIQSQ